MSSKTDLDQECSVTKTSLWRSVMRPRTALLLALYACATLQFTRFYVINTSFYLNVPAYLSGHERLPFQERVLPIFLMKLGYGSFSALHITPHAEGAFTFVRAPFYVISLVAIVVAGIFTQLLYERVSSKSSLSLLVYPVFLFTLIWSYVLHTEANYSYPYDMLSVAFFSAGLLFIYERRFLLLLAVILVGTFNRETTLFLIGIYMLDAASLEHPNSLHRIRSSFAFANVPWARVGLLFAVWLAIKIVLAHIFVHNSNAENYLRINENYGRLKLRLWPALLNMCGYMLPVVLVLKSELRPLRFRNYLWILPLWFGLMFCAGVLLETRIYGELCSYVAVSLVLIIEQQVRQHIVFSVPASSRITSFVHISQREDSRASELV